MSVLRLLAVIVSLSFACSAQEIRVAAAADLSSVMPALSAAYEKQTHTRVGVSLGSSGNFFTQIENGAPFDVFLSADRSYPEKLQQAGLTEPGTLVSYARGKLVLWFPNGSRVGFGEKDGTLTRDLRFLSAPSVHRIAIANPDHAPYGRAAVAVLQHYGIYDDIKAKLILGENISQAAQFAQSGNADAAFIAYSIALTPAMKEHGHFLMLLDDSYPPLEQAAVVPKSSNNKAQAQRFLEFLRSAEAQAILQQSGFGPATK